MRRRSCPGAVTGPSRLTARCQNQDALVVVVGPRSKRSHMRAGTLAECRHRCRDRKENLTRSLLGHYLDSDRHNGRVGDQIHEDL